MSLRAKNAAVYGSATRGSRRIAGGHAVYGELTAVPDRLVPAVELEDLVREVQDELPVSRIAVPMTF